MTIKEVTAEDLWDADTLKGTRDKMPVGNLFEYIHAQLLPEFYHPFLMAGWVEVTPLTGEGQQIFVAAVFAFHAGKAVVQIAAVEILVNDLLQIRPPETVFPGEMLIIMAILFRHSALYAESSYFKKLYIPAFAGMTKQGYFSKVS